jgi:hypothetical protein
MSINNQDRYSNASDGDQPDPLVVAIDCPPKVLREVPTKFLLYIDVKHGFKVIGGLEVLATVFQLFNLQYSVTVGVTCLILFNIPLLINWGGSLYYRHRGDYELAYKMNTFFLRVYFLRLVALVLGGFAFLLYSMQNDNVVNFFCDRYYADYMDDTAGVVKEGFSSELEACRGYARTVMWVFYIPTVVF